MAHLAVAAGGVDAFLISSELVGGLSRPARRDRRPSLRQALVALAIDDAHGSRPSTTLTYGADWSEWFSHHPTTAQAT